MKRWFVCAVQTDAEGNRTPRVSNYEVPYASIVSVKNWCFGILACQTPTIFDGDNLVYLLPDATLDAAWSSLPNNVRNAVTSRLGQAGFVTTGIQNSMTIRQVFNYIGTQIDSAANADKINIRDPWA